jgi:hypothetical protein
LTLDAAWDNINGGGVMSLAASDVIKYTNAPGLGVSSIRSAFLSAIRIGA